MKFHFQLKLYKTKFEELEIYQLSEKLCDQIWDIVVQWDYFPKNTVGMQLVNASDGIGSNIAEGSGNGSYADFKRYVKISRGSLFETKHWLRRAYRRKLINEVDVKKLKPLMDELLPRLSAFINYLDQKIQKR
jgi:four helix bundle protein